MTCACDTDASGEVTSPCGAHMNWHRYVVKRNNWEEQSKDLEKTKKDLDYQKKRADTFERLLVEKVSG